ncbi:MAG TPA: response regulator [Planctomycetota bacterium]|nr:response regulator [Planctomycetota bacterium]
MGEGSPAPLVLVVEDDEQMRRYLRAGLAAHGYRLQEAGNAEQGIRLAVEYPPDVVLLDLGLPDRDGIEVARRLREWSHVPILVLSARGQEEQKVAALDAGADDYLVKPFGFGELLARIRVALRHAAKGTEGAVLRTGPLTIDLERRRVELEGVEVHLTPIEWKILATLAKHADRVVTHRQLLQEVWGPRSTEQTHYLRVFMTHLRRKIEPDPVRPRLLQTEPGVGYRLRGDA